MSSSPRLPVLTVLAAVVVLTGCTGPTVLPLDHSFDSAPSRETMAVEVEHVVDGDTVIVTLPNGDQASVRLLGIDAPEVGATDLEDYPAIPDTQAARSCLRSVAHHARSTLQDTLAGATVRIGFDRIADRRGYYDRLLTYLIANDSTVNRKLVADGAARVYDTAFQDRDAYTALETDARARDRGLWSCRSAES